MLTRGAPRPSGRGPTEAVRDPVLRGAVLDVLSRVDRALELPSTNGSAAILADAGVARRELAQRLVRLAEALRRPQSKDRWAVTRDQLVDLLLDVRAVADRVDAEADGRWEAAFGRLSEAVAVVRATTTLDELLAEAPRAVIAFGFSRVILSAARDGFFVSEHCLDVAEPAREEEIVRLGSEPPVLLDRGLRETDMLRSREPLLVERAQEDPRGHPGLARATGWTSYVLPCTLRLTDPSATPENKINCDALGDLVKALSGSPLPPLEDYPPDPPRPDRSSTKKGSD